ncbi:hypothetical protein pipiens_004646 [Culex pipiens pipiens]|uniref:Peptidase S1 domain-containing protein n=1 Tax=Culex pipiens pipiens TaxID=38569 RepID=A0ABD1CGK4_CULPP
MAWECTIQRDCHLRYYKYSQFWRNPGYNGVPARLFEFAHMGAIGWTMPPDSSIDWRCGGSLITGRFVLTAAHCAVDSRNSPPDVVRFGDLDIFGPDGDEYAQQLGIAEIIRHPEHRFFAYYNDIALIKLGDSGGPLQVKLMHNFRETPFVVAVTSFGLPCGTSNPGVYTRVAPYLDWIVATMKDRGERVDDQTFNTTACARRYVSLRDPYEGVVQYRNETYVDVNYSSQHMLLDVELPPYIAKLGWAAGSTGADYCYGVIVDEEIVLTVADCVEFMGKPVNRIVTPEKIDVAAIYIHPEYKKGTSYNNIAILKLKNLLDFKSETTASCIWHDFMLPYERIQTIGVGRKDLVLLPELAILPDPTQVTYRTKITAFNETSCHLSKASLASMRHGFAHELVCAGNDFFLVPEVCNLAIGGPLFGTRWHDDREYGYTFALAQFGRDCGFGEHLLATRLWSHIDWMKSVLLPGHSHASSRLLFLERDRHEGDPCKTEHGVDGRCVALGECFQSRVEFLNRTDKQFCSSTEVVCCPLDVIEKKKKAVDRRTELYECHQIVSKLNVSSPYGFMIEIGSEFDDKFRCLGSIIATQIIVTTRSCLGNSIPTKVRSLTEVNSTIQVENVTFHDLYNASDSSFDIALLKLKTPIIWSPQLYPACLWMNKTHTPMITRMLFMDDDQVSVQMIQAKYNSDCQRVHPRELHRSQLCAKEVWDEPVCRKTGDVLVSQTAVGPSYLVGLALHEDGCSGWDYGTFTRISMLVDWINCRQRFFQYFYASDPFGISGLPARLYEFAHMGAIGWSQPNGTVDWRCGGSLIWDNFVLTAAHCAIDYRNVAPDVVRFGDLNIFTEEGDEYAQQIGIAKFIRHPGHRFSSHYHDIALIQLERNVTINETVLPACLWTDMEVRFKRMDAVGWGKVGFSGEQSPELLKMGLSPVSNEECGKVFNKANNRRLRTGLQEYHICASDEKADTCEGDSGGPLQVKLMHNMRETPFIVGVTSFGLPCSPENPGVYTRVASYVDWIVDTMQNHGAVVDDQTFNTTICALRHAPLREYYDGIVIERNEDVLLHESYNKTVGSNDIALVKIKESLTWSASIYPACLWMNNTHTPLVMRMIFEDDDHLDHAKIIARYNSDCQRTHPSPLHSSQLCGRTPRRDSVCRNASDVLISQPTEGGVTYLVGMAQHEDQCSSWRHGTFTRISALVGWIKRNVLNLDRWNT